MVAAAPRAARDPPAILTDAGSMVEWVKYSSYGVPFALPAGDTDSDGDWDATDSAAITGTYDVRKDANLDGVVSAADVTHANSITGGYQTLGRGILSSSGVANRHGYAGYEYDPTFEGAGRHLYHVRHRVYDADVGRWTRRDPLGYVGSTSMYEYVFDSPLSLRDPYGLQAQPLPIPTGPGLPSSPLRFPGDPTIPFKFPTPSPAPVPRPLPPACPRIGPGPLILCFVVGEIFYCIGREIGESLPDPPPVDLPPPKWPPRDRDRPPKDCSDAELAALLANQSAVCSDSDGKSTYDPCARMRSGSQEACDKAAEILGCIMAREAVSEFHRRCDAKRGVPPSESRKEYDNHRKRIRMLSKAMHTCNEKCIGADRDYRWWWD